MMSDRIPSGWSMAAFTLGLVGIVVPLASVLAVVCGSAALTEIRKGRSGGLVLAVSGLILGGALCVLRMATSLRAAG